MLVRLAVKQLAWLSCARPGSQEAASLEERLPGIGGRVFWVSVPPCSCLHAAEARHSQFWGYTALREELCQAQID